MQPSQISTLFSIDKETNFKCIVMKRIITLLLLIAALSALTSCIHTQYITYDDDEWSNSDWNSENVLLNGEIEIDDYER